MKKVFTHRLICIALALISLPFTAPATETNRIELLPGYNLLVNTMTNGANTLSELIPNAPEGTLVFTWDRSSFSYSAASQFVIKSDGRREWSNPNVHWPSWENAAVVASSTNTTVLEIVGSAAANPGPPPIPARFYGLISPDRLPTINPEDPKLIEDLDSLPLFRLVNGTFEMVSTFDPFIPAWDPPLPEFKSSEAICIGALPAPVLYFSNFAPVLGISNMWATPFSPLFSDWSARLMQTSTGGEFQSIGEAFPLISSNDTLSAAPNGGLLDLSRNLLLRVPEGMATFRIELFRSAVGSACSGQGSPFTLSIRRGLPTTIPNEHLAISVLPIVIFAPPQSKTSFVGSATSLSFSAGIGIGIYTGPTRWEKLQPDGTWQFFAETVMTDFSSPDSTILKFPSVSLSDAGAYRGRIGDGCFEQVTEPATLTVLLPPPELKLNIHHAVELEFPSENGATYQLEISENLADWKPLNDPVPGTGESVIRFQSLRDAPRTLHYRVRRIVP